MIPPLALLVGCGSISATTSPTPAPTPARATGPAARVDADGRMYDAYGPRQYSPFVRVDRDNIDSTATRPAGSQVDDSLLVPTDDEAWPP